MICNKKNETVWAKLRYCSYWPSCIVQEPPEILKQKIPRRKMCVYFFGSHNYGIVPVANIQPYLEFKSKYMNKNRSEQFQLAIKECDEYMIDDDANQCDVNVPHSGTVVLKTELPFDVKVEDHPDELCMTEKFNIEKQSNAKCIDCQDKQTLIDDLQTKLEATTAEFVLSKSEFQYLFVESNKKDRENQKLQSAVQSMQQCLTESKTKCLPHDELIQRLTSENDELKSNLKELQMRQGLYEVDKIVQHKRQRGKVLYLLRWQGYGSEDDSWVEENDLHCKDILDQYKELHGLK